MRSGAGTLDGDAVAPVVLPAAGAGARCATELSRVNAAEMLRAELRRWLAPGPPGDVQGLDLARLVTREVRWVGTHHLDPALLADLAAVRERYAGREPILDDFLDCVLAKYDGRYWNRTYLCLPVLERLIEGPDAPLDPVGHSSSSRRASCAVVYGVTVTAGDVMTSRTSMMTASSSTGPSQCPSV